jgi:hypothetical protein
MLGCQLLRISILPRLCAANHNLESNSFSIVTKPQTKLL